MKLVHIESNFPNLFGPIRFHDGLNVIFARVKDPTARQRSSHNLGKSFLIGVIDFALGGTVASEHPFRRREDLFSDFEFTLQLRTNDGRFVSARRPIKGRAACAVLVTDKPIPVGAYPPSSEWTHTALGLSAFKDVLNGLFRLSDIEPYPYRKGLGYQLRGQLDYGDEFRISKFSGGRDRDWRPFVARILGFRPDSFVLAYDIEDRIGSLKRTIDELQGSDQRRRQQFDEVRGVIEIREGEIARLRDELSRFQFTGVERTVNRELVHEIESRLGDLNVRRYVIDRDLRDIDQALSEGFQFDLEAVQRVYRAAAVELPDQLVHEFEELVAFNRKISSDRAARFTRLKGELASERKAIETAIDDLDRRRQEALGALREAEALVKYRQLTEHVLELEARLRSERDLLAQLSQAAALRAELAEQQKALLDVQTESLAELQAGNELFREVRRFFNAAVLEILGARAVLSADANAAGHIEVKTAILDTLVQERATFEGEGTSYKKLICACVDLALLQAHAKGSYYRFIYHDGVFEGLDNRRKVVLLDYVRRITAEHSIQYILTVIDSDLPRDDRDHKLMFESGQIILRLDDSGDKGRLFRMPRF